MTDAPERFACTNDGPVSDPMGAWVSWHDYMALRAKLDSASGVRAKPLEWKKQPDGSEHWGVGPFCCLRIIDWNKITSYPDRNYFEYAGEQIANLADAKAAAQADYERRILSALEPAPSYQDGWNAAIEAAAAECEDWQAFTRYAKERISGEMADAIRALPYQPPETTP